MTESPYTRRDSKNTPMMTVAGVIEWLDLEIEYLKKKHGTIDNRYAKDVLQGMWLHLEGMKEQLTGYAFSQLDEAK